MKRTIRKLLIILATLFISVGSTVAYLTDVDKEVNVMTLDRVEIDLIEEERNAAGILVDFQDNHPLYPGYHPKGLETFDKVGYWVDVRNAIDKIVTVKNTGKAPAYVRLWFAFEVTDDDAFFDKMIHLNCNTLDWQWKFMYDMTGQYDFLTQNETRYVVATATYNKVLASGATTPVSLRQVLLDSSATNADFEKLGDKYSIFVVAQGMQTAGFGSSNEALAEGFGWPTVKNHPFAGMKEETSNTEVPLVGVRAKTINNLNVAAYAGPSTSNVMAFVIPADTVVDVLSLISADNFEWYYVNYNGKKGYAPKTMLEIVPSEEPEEEPDDNLIYGEAKQDDVSVMSEPRNDAPILFTINKGYEFQIIEFVIDSEATIVTWLKVLCVNPADGTVYAGYVAWADIVFGITPDSNEAENDDEEDIVIAIGTIQNTEGVNFRTEPDKTSPSMSLLKAGVQVEIIEIPEVFDADHWFKVRYNGKVGYIQAPYVYIEGLTDIPTDTPDDPVASPTSDFTWEELIDGSGIRITQYLGDDDTVVIPEVIAGLPVSQLGNTAFSYCTSLKSIYIPSSITRIDSQTFWECRNLTNLQIATNNPSYTAVDSVLYTKDMKSLIWCPYVKAGTLTIPEGVKTIKAHAVEGCWELSGVILPDSLQVIEPWAFSSCNSLTNIQIPKGVSLIWCDAFAFCKSLNTIQVSTDSQHYASVNGVLFTKDMKTLLSCPGGKQGAYAIPDGVTKIIEYAFAGCTELTDIHIPDSVTTIEYSAFEECSNLKSIVIPNRMKKLTFNIFWNCFSLESVTVPPSVTSIDDGTFAETPLSTLTVYCEKNSYAHTYCVEKDIHFEFISFDGLDV